MELIELMKSATIFLSQTSLHLFIMTQVFVLQLAFPPLGIFDHDVSVFIGLPSTSIGMSFMTTPCNHLRDVPWVITFKCGASAVDT